jgi:hypothetical protein
MLSPVCLVIIADNFRMGFLVFSILRPDLLPIGRFISVRMVEIILAVLSVFILIVCLLERFATRLTAFDRRGCQRKWEAAVRASPKFVPQPFD